MGGGGSSGPTLSRAGQVSICLNPYSHIPQLKIRPRQERHHQIYLFAGNAALIRCGVAVEAPFRPTRIRPVLSAASPDLFLVLTLPGGGGRLVFGGSFSLLV